MSLLIPAYGNRLINLIEPQEELAALRAHASRLPSVQLSGRAACDLELLATGAFSPLGRFMGRKDYRSVLDEMRLTSGHIFPIPVTLPVNLDNSIRVGQEVSLCDARNELLAVMTVEEIYEWDRDEAAERVCGTRDAGHPLVAEMSRWGRYNIAGPLRVLSLPAHFDFLSLRLTPAEVRQRLESLNCPNVVAFQTRNPLHRGHEEITKRAAEQAGGTLLLHPVVGMTKSGDVDHYTRVRTYRLLKERYYDGSRTLLALLPLAMRMAGPREALWHAVIRRNYGANHFIVGRDHASPGMGMRSQPFYEPDEAQRLVERYQDEIGVRLIAFDEFVYLPDEARYEEAKRVTGGKRVFSLSGSKMREEYLSQGHALPAWFARPEVAKTLAAAYPMKHQQGFCVWFTGLSGAGKSVTAEILTALLLEHSRPATVLDGDVVRTHLSYGLGFSRADRDRNVLRIGFVASEVIRHGGVAICAAVSPYRATRTAVRNMVGVNRFVEVFVDTPLHVCEGRDTKGLYAKARRGEIKHFTGIDDPYEVPLQPEIRLESEARSPEENARSIVEYLIEQGFVRSD